MQSAYRVAIRGAGVMRAAADGSGAGDGAADEHGILAGAPPSPLRQAEAAGGALVEATDGSRTVRLELQQRLRSDQAGCGR